MTALLCLVIVRPGVPIELIESAITTPPAIDFRSLAREIIVQMRGTRSQRQVSDLLKYSFNQVGKWEGGFTQMKWSDFLQFGLELTPQFDESFRYAFWTLNHDLTVENTLDAIEKNLNLLAQNFTGGSELHKKWFSGGADPYLHDVLKLIGTRPAILLGWLSKIVDCRQINSLKKIYTEFSTRIDTVLGNPTCVYVNAALQLKFYKDLEIHDDALLAEHAACSPEELKKSLSLLCIYGVITYDGKKYHPCTFDFTFSGLRDPRIRNLTKHSTLLAATRYSTTPAKIDPLKTKNSSISSVRVAAVSAPASQKILELISKFHDNVGQILSQDHLPKDNVQVFILHSFASNVNSPKEKIDTQI